MKLLSIKYPTHTDLQLKRSTKPILYNIEEKYSKVAIANLLFEKCSDYLLLKLNNNLYIIEATNRIEKTYSRKLTAYHPYASLLN
jgi:hypothetical protein